MSMYDLAVFQPTKMLNNLAAWLQQAADSAATREFSPDVFVTSRLAPDMFSLDRQVQAACDAAKNLAARLAGQEAPSHPDTETTFAELQTRISTVLKYLETFTPAQFEGCEERLISLPFLPGQASKATDYLVEMALPNFYFHISMAYAILRHNGVALGKRAFIGSLRLQEA